MFTEFHHISFLGMTSNSDLFIVKEDQKQIEFEVSSIPTLQFPDGCQDSASNEPELDNHQEEQEHNKEEEKCEATASSEEVKRTPSFGEFEVAENDDGFRTPTSLDHKIPLIAQCPPAPRKLRPPPSTKRKVPPQLRRNLQLVLSKEVESMFTPPLQEDLGRKIKRARRDQNTE